MRLLALSLLSLAAFWTWMWLMVLLTALYRRWRSTRRFRPASASATPPRHCLLVRPCAGDEVGLLRCLTSVAEAKRDFPMSVVFGVDCDTDTALPTIDSAIDILATRGIKSTRYIAPVIGPNRKVSILAGCVAVHGAGCDVIISADSNADLSGFDLGRFAATLCTDARAAAVWAPPRIEVSDRGWGNRAAEAVLHGSWQSFGLLSAIDPAGMVGKLFAVRRQALADIGGFESLVRYLGEDMEMSKRLRRAGFGVASFPASIKTVAGRMTWQETLARHARWIMVIKAQRRCLLSSYPLLFFSALIVYLFALLGLYYSVVGGAACLIAAVIMRLLVGYSASRMLGLSPGPVKILSQAFIADALLCAAFFRALTLRTVDWRGRSLSFGPNGALRDEEK